MTKLYLVLLGTGFVFSGVVLSLAGWANIGAGALIVGVLLIAMRPVLLLLGAVMRYPTAEQDAQRIVKLEMKGNKS